MDQVHSSCPSNAELHSGVRQAQGYFVAYGSECTLQRPRLSRVIEDIDAIAVPAWRHADDDVAVIGFELVCT